MKKYILLWVCLLTSLYNYSCSSSWHAYPDDVKYRMCYPYSNDSLQMIFVPGYDETVVVIEDCNQFRRQKVAIAIQSFELAWQTSFGHDRLVFENLRKLVITFSSDEKIQMGYTADGSLVQHGIIEGSTLTKEAIWVYSAPGAMRICETSFVHELVHASLWARNGHGDPDHTGTRFFGWSYNHFALIDRVNRYLCVLGI